MIIFINQFIYQPIYLFKKTNFKRTVSLVFMILAFLVGGFCAGILFKNIEKRIWTDGDSKKTEEVYKLVANAQKQLDEFKKAGVDITKSEDPEIKEYVELIESVPPRWKVDYAGKLGIALAVLSLIMVVVAFMKKELVTKLSVLVAVLSVVLWAITPYIKEGMFSGANPKSIALIACIGLVVCSACAFMSYKLYLKKSQVTA